MNNEKRSRFTGKIGFVLASAGSAVGLGNIWRFPYLAAKYGGGIFLLIYVALALTLGFVLMISEIAVGRKTGFSTIEAYKKLNKKFSFIGYLGALVGFFVLPYYSVIGGWVVKYLYVFLSNDFAETSYDKYFSSYISHVGEPFFWFMIFIIITTIIILFGVEKGIEKFSKILMPALVVVSIFIAAYSCFLPNALQGIIYYLKPDFSHFSYKTILAAMGQLFYSLSIAMGILVTYGSYMKKDISLESSVRQIEFFDTGIAFLAGLMVIPAVFSFSGGTPEALSKGPQLMFVTMPEVFNSMSLGRYMGIAFFFLVFLAALTSSVSLMEAPVSVICDTFKVKRKYAVLIAFALAVLLGSISVFGYSIWKNIKIIGMQFLDFFDFLTNSVLMPITSFFTCIFIGYVLKPKNIIEEIELTGIYKRKHIFVLVIKYLAPACILLIMLSSVLEALGITAF